MIIKTSTELHGIVIYVRKVVNILSGGTTALFVGTGTVVARVVVNLEKTARRRLAAMV